MSVTDKTGVVEFARALSEEFGAQIISTGGTARVIAEAGIPVTPIDEVTQFPEMWMGSREDASSGGSWWSSCKARQPRAYGSGCRAWHRDDRHGWL